MLFPASFKLALMCCSCMHHLLQWVASCSFVIHHAHLCIIPCTCVVCLLCCVLLFDSSCFVAIVRIRSSTLGSSSWLHLLHGLILLPSRISSKMTITLDLTTILAMLVALMLSLCRATYHLFIKPPIVPCQASNPPSWQTIVWLCYRFCSAPLIALLVAGEVEDFSMVDKILIGISQYLLYYY